jgi:Mrp family chromosome partitioning ATPase
MQSRGTCHFGPTLSSARLIRIQKVRVSPQSSPKEEHRSIVMTLNARKPQTHEMLGEEKKEKQMEQIEGGRSVVTIS